MPFKSGDEWIGNPNGRPKGSYGALSKAKKIIFDTLDKNEDTFREAMQEAFDTSPIKFYITFIQPFMPKEVKMEAEITNHLPLAEIAKTKKNVIKELDSKIKKLKRDKK